MVDPSDKTRTNMKAQPKGKHAASHKTQNEF